MTASALRAPPADINLIADDRSPNLRRPGLRLLGAPMTPSQATDLPRRAELLSRIADGDDGAFAEFYDATAARVYGMVLRVLRDPGYSEETTQEVFLQVWRSAGSYSADAGSPLSWLITMAHRRAVDRVRSESASSRRDIRYAAQAQESPFDLVSDAVGSSETAETVVGCLGSLTDVQRQSVVLAYYEGLTYREVAERLSVALPTVKSRIRDGMIRLRRCLGGADV